MAIGFLRVLCAASIAMTIACSEERALYPVVDSEPLVHDPWDDQEAEDIACMISGELTAPRALYERVQSDLVLIRERWGDSIPRLRTTKAIAPYIKPEFGLDFQPQALDDIKAGRHAAWDSLLQLFRMSMTISSYGYPYVSTEVRLNTWRAYQSFEQLEGFKQIWPSYFRLDGPRLYAHLVGEEVRYLLRDAWGDCPAGCIASQYYYFKVEGDSVHYFGSRRSYPPGDAPTWWIVAKQAVVLWEDGDPEYRFRDATPPGRVEDLRLAGSQIGAKVTVQFTAPGDLGLSSHPSTYVFRWTTDSVTEANWYPLPYKTFTASAVEAGTRVNLELNSLPLKGRYYLAMRSVDKLGNVSRVSNNVISENQLTFGWTTYDSGNSPLPDNNVTRIYFDRQSRVWIATRTGMSVLQGSDWTVFGASDHSVFSKPVITITEDREGGIWVGSEAGAASLTEMGWVTRWPVGSASTEREVRCILVDDENVAWLGVGFSGVYRLSGPDWTQYESVASGVRGTIVRRIEKSADGAVWVGSNNGLSRFNGGEWAPFGPQSTITSILAIHSDTILCGSYDGRLRRIINGVDSDELRMSPHESWPRQLPSVTDIVQSGDGSIWLTTYGSVRRYHRDSLEESVVVLPSNSLLPDREITSLAAESRNCLWIGTKNYGVCRWTFDDISFGQTHTILSSSE